MNTKSLKILRLKCPQNWGFDKYRDIEDHLLRKESGWNENEEEEVVNSTKYAAQVGGYRIFCLLSYECYRKGKYDEALKYLEKTDVTDDFIKKYDRVFKHVIRASKAHILFKQELNDEAQQIVDELNSEKYSAEEEACFMYLECSLKIKYGESGADGCIHLIESALKVVDDEAEYHFMLGVTLSRIRHHTFPSPPPSKREFDSLHKAVSLRRDLPEYGISLARLYMDFRFNLSKEKRNQYSKLAETIYRNLIAYHESLSGNDIARCVYNLMKLRPDSDLEEYAKIARKKSNSVLVNHYIGMYYLRNNQYEEALECLDNVCDRLPYLTGVVLLLLYRIGNNNVGDQEVNERIEQWLPKYQSSDSKELLIFHLSMSQFYLIVKNDLKNAAIHFNNAYKCEIKERFFINLSKYHSLANYLKLLKDELLDYCLNDEVILKARKLISLLQGNVVGEKNRNWKSPSLIEVRRGLL